MRTRTHLRTTCRSNNPPARGAGRRRGERRNECVRLSCCFKRHPIFVPIPMETVRGILVPIRDHRCRHTCWSSTRRTVGRVPRRLHCGHFGTRGAGGTPCRGSIGASLGSTHRATPHLDELKTELREHGAFGGKMFVLGVAEGTVEISTKGTTPAGDNASGHKRR